ncbi:hypothetical protein [Alkalimarinus coralli]|uniref:hypothetical protein n=1 Tax=Alkalimarinus coralli TaxID=2935863 RepID=UPI00202AE244|nr:hypothetical protein [Alkalimarinus coralli]
MGYVKEKLTPENCIKIQNDLANEVPKGLPDFWKKKAHVRGSMSGVPTDYETPLGVVSDYNYWVFDRERNFYAVRLTYVLEVKSIVLFLDGEIHLLETEPMSQVLKPLQIEGIEKGKNVKREAELAIDALYDGSYYFKEDM